LCLQCQGAVETRQLFNNAVSLEVALGVPMGSSLLCKQNRDGSRSRTQAVERELGKQRAKGHTSPQSK